LTAFFQTKEYLFAFASIGLKDVIVEKIEELNDKIAIHVKLPLGTHTCPNCGRSTKKVHGYRVQKVNHLKWFERFTVLF